MRPLVAPSSSGRLTWRESTDKEKNKAIKMGETRKMVKQHKPFSRKLKRMLKARKQAGEGGHISIRERFVNAKMKQLDDDIEESAGIVA